MPLPRPMTIHGMPRDSKKLHELTPVCLFPCLIRVRGIRMQGYGRSARLIRKLFQQALSLPDLLIGKPNVGQKRGTGRRRSLHGKGHNAAGRSIA